jgi:hypothetical protein
MLRIVAGIVAGFFAWMILWFGGEQIIASVWPRFDAHQAAFQSAIENGGPFIADSTILLVHILLASIVSAISGFLAALIAGENKRSPLILGCLLLAMGLLKASMTWALVPLWYHVIFTAILLPMTMIGGKLKAAAE